jgi:hypothetical protein
MPGMPGCHVADSRIRLRESGSSTPPLPRLFECSACARQVTLASAARYFGRSDHEVQ